MRLLGSLIVWFLVPVALAQAGREKRTILSEHTVTVGIPAAVPNVLPATTEDVIICDINQSPEFPGGEEALHQYLVTNAHFAEAPADTAVGGKIIVRFVVEPSGRISHVEIAKGLSQSMDQEALRVVSSMPAWKPGRSNGQPISSVMMLPFEFSK